MAYEKLKKTDEDDSLYGHDSDRIMQSVEMKSLDRDEADTNSPVGDTATRLQETESEENNSDSQSGSVAEDGKSLIRNEIDENGLTEDYEVALKYTGFGFFHILLLVVNGVALSSDAIEVLSIAYILPIIREKDEFDTADWQTALLSSIIFLGMLFGSYFWGSLSDLSGRRCTLLMSLTVNGVFGLCSAFAPNYSVFLVFRFFSGFGVGGSLPVIYSFASEYVRNKYRGPYFSVQAMFWVLGGFLCGALAWVIIPRHISAPMGSITIHSWRVFIAVSAVPSLLGAVLYLFLPESPRYLLEVGKEGKALKALRLVYRLNHLWSQGDSAEYPVKSIVLQGNPSTDLWRIIIPRGEGDNCRAHNFYKIKEILRRTLEMFQRKLVKRTVFLLVILFCLSFGSYGVTLWYPTYVKNVKEQIDADKFNTFCSQTLWNHTVEAEIVKEYCGCSMTEFENIVFQNLEISDWYIINATFNRVVFETVNISNVIFRNSLFSDCNMKNVSFKFVHFIDTVWKNTSLLGVDIQFSDFCSENFIEVEGFTVNGSTVPDLTFTQLLESKNSSSCSNVPTLDCDKEEDDRDYRDNFLIAASAIPGNIVNAIAVYFLRRNYWLAFILLSSAASVFLLYIAHSEVFVVVMLCLFTAISSPAWNSNKLLIAELYPTHLRSTAMGVHFLMARIGAIAGANVFGECINTNPSIPILLVAGVLLVGGVTAICLPKTTRKTALM